MYINKITGRIPLLAALLVLVITGCEEKEPANPVTAAFSVRPSSVNVGDTVQFFNNSINATVFQWDFGDGNSSIEEEPIHVYQEAGNYSPKLTAIGTSDSDTATQDVTVNLGYEITIFEGIGIEGLDLKQPWFEVEPLFTTDTAHFVTFLEEFEVYRHDLYYPAEGLGFLFFSDTTFIPDSALLVFMVIFAPYEGATEQGISINSTMQQVIVKYGQPENLIEEEDLTGYWYDSKGIDFYSFGTDFVDEIDIYDPADFAKKSSPVQSILKKPPHPARLFH